MVEITSAKRKRPNNDNKRVVCDKASRYTPSFHFSALTYKQAPAALAISPQSVLVSVPTHPNPTQFNIIAGDIFSMDSANIHKSPIGLVESYHKQYTITHLEWNQKGNAIASVDETGQLALWSIKSSMNQWELIYKVDMKQPLAAFLWLNSERSYGIDTLAKEEVQYRREPLKGPRNPFGQLGFITITVHGEITVHYQRNGSIFSSFSTPMPNIGRREISRADAGCFGMSLAGLDDWERISHAAITLHNDGQIYLATHNVSIQPKSVAIHTIKINFRTKSEKGGAIECKPVTSLKIQGKDLLRDNHVTQMIFRKGTDNVELVIGLGDETEDLFDSFISSWQLKTISQSISIGFETITNDRTALVYQSGTKISGRFISSLKSTNTGQIMVGLSDGSIYAESAPNEPLMKNSNMDDMMESINENYWTAVEPHNSTDGCVDPIADLVLSPNETHLVYIFASTKIGVARITNDEMNEGYVKAMVQKLQLCLLNDTDFIDLVAELARMHLYDDHHDKPDEILDKVLTTYEIICTGSKGNKLESNEPLENWSSAKLAKAYGLVMAVYKRLSGKGIQSINLSRAIQLPLILDCFISSCTSDSEELTRVLEAETIDESIKLEFDPDSLWSLISLFTWTCDYVQWVLREWNLLVNRKRPQHSTYANIKEIPVHAVLLLHKDSQTALCKILKLLHHFLQYTSTTSDQLHHFSETQGLLQKYTSTLLNDEIISLKDTIAFLHALSGLKENTTEVKHRWSLVLSSALQSYELLDIQKITNKFKDKCAKPSIYLGKEPLYPFDVIRKRRIPNEITANQCIRCQQAILPIHTSQDINDPYSSAQWYQSLGRRCVCGGVFY